VKGKIGGGSIEKFITSPQNGGRVLGTSEAYDCPNETHIMFTGNGATLTRDMTRRSQIISLFMKEERAEDRRFKRTLDNHVLSTMRPRILSAVWALIRNWNEAGRPEPSLPYPSFPEWAKVIGGIVESAGYVCPLHTPKNVIESVDEELSSIRVLVGTMGVGRNYANTELASLCRELEIYGSLVGRSEEEQTPGMKIAFGRMLQSYSGRIIGMRMLTAAGKNNTRRYSAVLIGEGDGLSVLGRVHMSPSYPVLMKSGRVGRVVHPKVVKT